MERPADDLDTSDWVDGAPVSGREQTCALCNARPVAWVHPLAEELATFPVYGALHTLPTFWTLCERCEGVYASGDDDAALAVMMSEGSWVADGEVNVADPADVDECIRKPLAAFRRADRGARRLVD